MDVTEAITDGIEHASNLMGGMDRSLVQGTAMYYRDTRSVLDPIIQQDGKVVFAMAGMVISSVRAQAILVITNHTVVIAWRQGVLKKRVEHVAIKRSDITKAEVAAGPGSLSGARILSIESSQPLARFALPKGAANFEAWIVNELNGLSN